ncbi:MAG: Glycine cleavage system protein [Verrucomicrobiota bacterium]|jgi:glycine cleavage system H protein
MAETFFYKRATFVTHLPKSYLFSPSHYWLAQEEDGIWRVGFTKFATRMLGDLVDHQFEKQPGDSVSHGEVVGSVEGFKAISDLYSPVAGQFVGGNPALLSDPEKIGSDPYGSGWLFRVTGTPDARCGDWESYQRLLDATIDRMLEKQGGDASATTESTTE